MNKLKLYSKKDIESFITTREGETKFGEQIGLVSSLSLLNSSEAKYVIFGIPEDIGVRANFGKAGARDAWQEFLKSFLNIQVNQFNNPENVLLLGEIDCKDWLSKAELIEDTDPNFSAKLHDIITKIDAEVSQLVEAICEADKIPIIIGGGHNNAYGNLKGLSEAKQLSINVLNIDAHTDLRKTDFRHSGNGFSAAYEENYIEYYTVFGLHKNYTPDYIFKSLDSSKYMDYALFEDFYDVQDARQQYQQCLSHIAKLPFGIELDCDAIANFPSSAQTPSGFSLEQIREFLRLASVEENLGYIHICEAKPSTHYNVGKALSYLVSDIIQQ